MKRIFQAFLLSFAVLVTGINPVFGANTPQINITKYKKSDLYGLWYISSNEKDASGVIFIYVNKDGTAIDAMFGENAGEAIKVKQRSSWTYDEEENIFKQDIKEISIQVGNENPEISHPNEIITSSIEIIKLGDEIMGIKFIANDGKVTGYYKVTDEMYKSLLDMAQLHTK